MAVNDIFSSVGTTISVVDQVPATFDLEGYSALTYELVGEATEIPAFGAEAALATHTPLATGIVNKRRGSVNFGSVTVPMALSASDSGQTLLSAAGRGDAGEDAQVTVEVKLPASAGGTSIYFTAQVMSFKTNISNADSIAMAEVTLEIDSKVVLG